MLLLLFLFPLLSFLSMGVFPPSPRVSKLYCRSIDPKVDQRKLTKPLNLLAIDNALYTRNEANVRVHLGIERE
ncbi:hypothetical protein C8Q69DRAFT_475547 [Paecilomyces variotii]|uniref:Secreted protein n=1 Tax=Byssochlamys spectabilis TaxID=264951 RepID=A0A443HN27_BYSSP|nr:hypothetical protein C8Q69DRAFT_475547 [Paecilomyces variotii]RWQ93217.1 hypothetical protein C8Q69DRAFT_475547 [Paecilomyces variotii]